MFPEDISYILPNFHFMFFDRYVIHIQAFVDFINGQLIIFRSSSPQNYAQNIYAHFHNKKTGKHDTHRTHLVPMTYIFLNFVFLSPMLA